MKNKVRFVRKHTRTISWWKVSLPPQKESWASFWTFSFHFLSFNGVFSTLKCRTLVLKHLHGDNAAAICLKWISVTKVSKYGKIEYSRALNASYTFQPLMSFWWLLKNKLYHLYSKGFVWVYCPLLLFRSYKNVLKSVTFKLIFKHCSGTCGEAIDLNSPWLYFWQFSYFRIINLPIHWVTICSFFGIYRLLSNFWAKYGFGAAYQARRSQQLHRKLQVMRVSWMVTRDM